MAEGVPEIDLSILDQPLKFTYAVYRIDPQSPHLPFLSGRFAALSMRALVTDPKSFGMAYNTEAAWSPSDWTKRISRPNVHIFVCVAHPEGVEESLRSIEHGVWVGMVTQIGPTPKEIYWLREAGVEEPLDDALETKWHQTATWTDPAHRGKGISKQIIEAAVAFAAESIRGTVQQARVRAFTGPQNEVSMALYGSRGFPIVGKISIEEAILANGNAGYPFHGRTDWPKEMMTARLGIMVERVVRKA